jgi:hypothetical protein
MVSSRTELTIMLGWSTLQKFSYGEIYVTSIRFSLSFLEKGAEEGCG